MTARRWCCGCMERRGRWVLSLGGLGMTGFVASLAAMAAGRLGLGGFVGGVLTSLGAFAASLLVGHLGDPFELGRREPAGARPQKPGSPPAEDPSLAPCFDGRLQVTRIF